MGPGSVNGGYVAESPIVWKGVCGLLRGCGAPELMVIKVEEVMERMVSRNVQRQRGGVSRSELVLIQRMMKVLM